MKQDTITLYDVACFTNLVIVDILLEKEQKIRFAEMNIRKGTKIVKTLHQLFIIFDTNNCKYGIDFKVGKSIIVEIS